MIVWLTGQPGAGKTTLAQGMAARLREVPSSKFAGQLARVGLVDGDDMRVIMENPGYDKAGRHINIDRAQTVAAFLDQHLMDYVFVALVAPYREQRDEFRETHDVIEVYVHTTDIRGREEFHVNDYEQPDGDHYIDIDTTGELAVDSIRRLHRALAAVSQGS